MITRKILATLVLFIAISLPASSSNVSPAAEPGATDPKAQQLLLRLDQIKAMDKSTLTGTEKKILRNEVKEIKKELKVMSGGVYLSIGAIIIVILLLILLL